MNDMKNMERTKNINKYCFVYMNTDLEYVVAV